MVSRIFHTYRSTKSSSHLSILRDEKKKLPNTYFSFPLSRVYLVDLVIVIIGKWQSKKKTYKFSLFSLFGTGSSEWISLVFLFIIFVEFSNFRLDILRKIFSNFAQFGAGFLNVGLEVVPKRLESGEARMKYKFLFRHRHFTDQLFCKQCLHQFTLTSAFSLVNVFEASFCKFFKPSSNFPFHSSSNVVVDSGTSRGRRAPTEICANESKQVRMVIVACSLWHDRDGRRERQRESKSTDKLCCR